MNSESINFKPLCIISEPHPILTFLQAFVALSIAGTAFHGYCFAFHLLNIVNNNQLLGGVIQAITQNGMYNYVYMYVPSLNIKKYKIYRLIFEYKNIILHP